MKGESVCRILGMAICVLVATAEARPRYIECTESWECGLDSCCVLGVGRYSLPRCMNLREVGDPCRPFGQIPYNTTVSYPDGERVDLSNIYSVLCPCQQGLYCSDRTATCQDSTDFVNRNSLLVF